MSQAISTLQYELPLEMLVDVQRAEPANGVTENICIEKMTICGAEQTQEQIDKVVKYLWDIGIDIYEDIRGDLK